VGVESFGNRVVYHPHPLFLQQVYLALFFGDEGVDNGRFAVKIIGNCLLLFFVRGITYRNSN
jgi:hypothetical protein